MGKKRKFKWRTRTVYKKAKGGSKSLLTGVVGKMVAAGIYGALRERVSDALAPATAKIPAGEISDEVGMLGLNYVLSRALPAQLRPAARAGMVIEAARIGEFIADKGLQGLKVGGTGQQTVVSGAVF